MQNKNNRNGSNHRINAISTENYKKTRTQQQRPTKAANNQATRESERKNATHNTAIST